MGQFFIIKALVLGFYLLPAEQNTLVTFLHPYLHCRLLEQVVLGLPKNNPSTSCLQKISKRNEMVMHISAKFFIFF